jgi:tripartite-type tricarboxylate transporter receptor subunit TctC
MRRRDSITIVAGALLPVFLSLLIVVPGEPAWSQSGKSIRIIVPFPPGGSADVLARILVIRSAKQMVNPLLLITGRAPVLRSLTN